MTSTETSVQLVLENTPVETYYIGQYPVRVKREDLCCPYPGPMFSKIRGVVAHIRKRDEPTIGVLDTFHSKGGWAVAYVCNALKKKCIDFYPVYKDDKELRPQQKMCRDFGASLIPLKAGMSAVLYHLARRGLKSIEEESGMSTYLMPNALKLPESVEETALECIRTDTTCDTMVISISSATIAAGVLKGLAAKQEFPWVILHMGYDRSEDQVREYISGLAPAFPMAKVMLINEKYAYKQEARHGIPSPFPANPFYDLKAWQWLCRNINETMGNVLFWDVGA